MLVGALIGGGITMILERVARRRKKIQHIRSFVKLCDGKDLFFSPYSQEDQGECYFSAQEVRAAARLARDDMSRTDKGLDQLEHLQERARILVRELGPLDRRIPTQCLVQMIVDFRRGSLMSLFELAAIYKVPLQH